MDGWKETQQSNSVLQKVTCRCLNDICNVGNADILVQTKAKSVAKVIEDHPLGNMHVCTHFHPNQIETMDIFQSESDAPTYRHPPRQPQCKQIGLE